VTTPGEPQAEITVRDLTGRLVATLQRGRLEPGEHLFRWDGATASGQHAPAGVYFIEFRGRAGSVSRRLCLLR